MIERPSPGSGLVRVLRLPLLRYTLLAITFAYIAWALAGQWGDLRASASQIRVQWNWVLLSTAAVLVTYAALVQSWRMLLAGWGSKLGYLDAVRIWTIANLGRWIPGKVWSVGALGIMAAEQGVSGTAAAGAALLGTLLNLGAGMAVTVLLGARVLESIKPGMANLATLLAILFALGIAALPWLLPPILDRLARWRGLKPLDSHLSAGTLWAATLINLASWVGYGLAFQAFARGVVPGIGGGSAFFIAVYSASYLVGYLVLFSPGGLGFREIALVAILISLGAANRGDATILSVTSRIWLTVLEILPGLLSLAFLPRVARHRLGRST